MNRYPPDAYRTKIKFCITIILNNPQQYVYLADTFEKFLYLQPKHISFHRFKLNFNNFLKLKIIFNQNFVQILLSKRFFKHYFCGAFTFSWLIYFLFKQIKERLKGFVHYLLYFFDLIILLGKLEGSLLSYNFIGILFFFLLIFS